MHEHDTAQIPWHDIGDLLLRRHRLVLSIFGLGLAATLLLAVTRTPSYRATAKLMVTSERARITVSPDPKSGPTIDRVTDQDLNSETALLKSDALVREVLQRLAPDGAHDQPRALQQLATLLRHPLELPMWIYRTLHRVPAETPFDRWVERVATQVTVTPVKTSNLIELSYEGGTAEWTARLVNALAAHHVERHVRMNKQLDLPGFFERQRELLADKLHAAEADLRHFYEREGIDSLPDQRLGLQGQLATSQAALARSETELAEAAARADFLDRTVRIQPKTLPVERGGSQVDPLRLIRARQLELQLQRSQLLSTYAPTSVKVQDVDRQIAEAERLLSVEQKSTAGSLGSMNPTYTTLQVELAQTQAQIAAVKARTQALQTQIAETRIKLEHFDQITSEYERLQQAVSSAKDGLATYVKKEEEARFSAALDESRMVNVAIIEPAEVPATPEPSRQSATLFSGTVASVLIALAAAFITDRLDPTLKSARQAYRLTGLPILGEIPS